MIDAVMEPPKVEIVNFLQKHEDYTLFLLGNYENYGYRLTEAPYSGNYKILREDDRVSAVFCLTRNGTLLIQSEIDDLESIFSSCEEEKIPIQGVIGEWGFCSKLWEHIKSKGLITAESFVSKEVLYSIDLHNVTFEKEPAVRFLEKKDFDDWKVMRNAYNQEMGLPEDLTPEQILESFLKRVSKRYLWGLFLEDKLIAIAGLNAQALDLGQVGGVFTDPSFRNKGYSKALMKQLVRDCKEVHSLRKLIIFTDKDNTPARRVYESLGVEEKGYLALFFGS